VLNLLIRGVLKCGAEDIKFLAHLTGK